MHVPDGLIGNGLNAATWGVSAAACGMAVARARGSLHEKQVPLLGMTAAFVFAAQMLNFPIGAGISGHFLGALFVAIILGPLNSLVVMTVVLAIQCLLFADGGFIALGTNVFNMGVVGGLGGYLLWRLLRTLVPRTRGSFLVAAAIAAWGSVVAASAACAVEIAVSGASPLGVVLPAIVGIHALIGIGEAFITAAAISVILAARPDLVAGWKPAGGGE